MADARRNFLSEYEDQRTAHSVTGGIHNCVLRKNLVHDPIDIYGLKPSKVFTFEFNKFIHTFALFVHLVLLWFE